MIQISEEPLGFIQRRKTFIPISINILPQKTLYVAVVNDYRAKWTLWGGIFLYIDRVFPQNILGFLLKRKVKA